MSRDYVESIQEDGSTISLLQEDAVVHIQKRVTGVVRIEKSVRHDEQIISEDLASETVSVEHVAVNRYIDEPELMRQEGEVTIIPVMEEIVITRKQLVLKEEIRVRRNRIRTHYQETIPVRAEELKVLRLTPEQADGTEPAAVL